MTISEIIKKHGPIKRDALAKKAGCKERQVQVIINEQIRAGVPIVRTGKGFVIASTRAEINADAARLTKHGISCIVRAANLRKQDVEQLVRKLDFAGAQ